MTEVINGSEIVAATTEIPLDDDESDQNESTNNEIETNGDLDSPHQEEVPAPVEIDNSNDSPPTIKPASGAQTYVVGSSNVGSRLAGDAVGSRLASSGITADTQSKNDPQQSPIYKPAETINSSRTKSQASLGFGNSVPPTSAGVKLSNVTFQEVQQVASAKAGIFKSWSVKTFKCTKQIFSEKFGRGMKTVDLELEAKIEILKDTKRKYENLLMLTRLLAKHFTSIIQTQKALSGAFGELSAKSQELQDEFNFNAETQVVLAKNGEKLVAAINFFTSGVSTLCSKTMEDTLLTINRFESARLQFDAYRSELEILTLAPRTEANVLKQANAQSNFDINKEVFDKLRQDVNVKLQFLDENRVKVMQKQLLIFHNATAAYFAGNQEQLEVALQQCNLNSSKISASWLEKE